MRVDILTLFPGMFQSVTTASILGIAQDKGLLDLRISNIRNFSYDKHRVADDRPYGGGPGMVLKPEPVFRALEAIWTPAPARRILFSPQGRVFNQAMARDLVREQHLILICGHYEGFDERIVTGLELEEVSIGDYILTGGEIPAMAVLDAVVRLIPGVLGGAESAAQESFTAGLLDYPQYTRPPVWRGMAVPAVLRSGNHAQIAQWRHNQALTKTQRYRPDLLKVAMPERGEPKDE